LFNIILLDPAWKYNARKNEGTKFGKGVDGHYGTMTIKQISELPIGELASENCAMFMWCTFPQLDEQIQLFKKWGFDYKTVAFTWVKTNPRNNKPFFGIGYYAKSNAEVCLLGIKGKMKPVSNSVSSIIISPRQEHSRKPDEARNRIIQLFGDIPRIELFARQRCDGWTCLGNELSGKDIGQEIKELIDVPR
jgi:N6-adenosine-specific RNA methylase IME4